MATHYTSVTEEQIVWISKDDLYLTWVVYTETNIIQLSIGKSGRYLPCR